MPRTDPDMPTLMPPGDTEKTATPAATQRRRDRGERQGPHEALQINRSATGTGADEQLKSRRVDEYKRSAQRDKAALRPRAWFAHDGVKERITLIPSGSGLLHVAKSAYYSEKSVRSTVT